MIDSIIIIVYLIVLEIISYKNMKKIWEDTEVEELEKIYEELRKEKRGGRRG